MSDAPRPHSRLQLQRRESGQASLQVVADSAARKGMRGFRSTVATVVLDMVKLQALWPSGKEIALEEINMVLGVIEQTGARSDATIVSTGGAGASTILAWNTTRPCTMHAVQSARFVGLLRRGLDDHQIGAGQPSTGFLNPFIGISAGNVLHLIAGSQKKYTLLMGGPVDTSGMLARVAADLGAGCLSIGLSGVRGPGQEPQLKHLSRSVDHWTMNDGASVVVDELSVPGLLNMVNEGVAGVLASAGEGPQLEEQLGWCARTRAALKAADAGGQGPPKGDCSALQEICKAVPQDSVLAKVTELKVEGRRLVSQRLSPMLFPQVGRQRAAAVRSDAASPRNVPFTSLRRAVE